MKRGLLATIALLTMGATATVAVTATPALADDVDVRDHRKKKKGKGDVKVDAKPAQQEPRVTGFSPQSGQIGTVVTISGQYFQKQTKVIVGGRPVKEISWTDSEIKFAMPKKYYDGVITLRHPGMGSEIPVGTFTVIEDPWIAKFSPHSGPAGTRVELLGKGFMQGDQVLFNGKVLPAAELNANRIVVVIPPGATSDYFTISRPGSNYAAQSKKRFEVTLPAPSYASMNPTSGPPGTQVRINGANFGPNPKVTWAGLGVQVVQRTDSWLDVVAPPNGRGSASFRIDTGYGWVETSSFTMLVNPAVTKINPTYGPAGTRVDIYGKDFAQGDQVYLGNTPVAVVGYAPDKITVTSPQGPLNSAFVIKRGGVEVARSKQVFVATVPPTISGFSPAYGKAGSVVTITGAYFEKPVKVYYGNKVIPAKHIDGRTLEVTVPNGLGNQPFLVETWGGRAQSATSFQIVVESVVTGVNPTQGPPGTRVTIVGNYFTGNETFYLEGAALPISEKGKDSYVVTIPANAKSGWIEMITWNHRIRTNHRFDVVQPAGIASFSPTYGPAGTQVMIKGVNFSNSATAYFGNLPCQIVKRNPGWLVVVIPPNATGSDYFWIEDYGVRVKSPSPFKVTAALGISGYSPASGPPGTNVTISGDGFTAGSRVTLGNLALGVKSWTANQIVVTIPEGAKSDYLWVYEANQKVRSAGKYQVTAAPQPEPAKCTLVLSPTTGPAGSQVTISASGCEFYGSVKAWFGTTAASVISVNKNAITVEIPKNATGANYITVEMDGGGGVAQRRRTTEKFTVGAGGVKVKAKPNYFVQPDCH